MHTENPGRIYSSRTITVSLTLSVVHHNVLLSAPEVQSSMLWT